MVHALAGDGLDRSHAGRRAAARLGAVAVPVPGALGGRGARARAVRAPDGGRRDRVRRAAPGRRRALGLGDPAGPRLLQRRRRGARRRRLLGGPRSASVGRAQRRSGRRPPTSAPADGAAARPRARVGRVDRLPLLLHVVRGDPHPRRAALRDSRDRDLQPGGASVRPPHGGGARPAPTGRGRRRRARLGEARAAARRRSPPGSRARGARWAGAVAVAVVVLGRSGSSRFRRSLSCAVAPGRDGLRPRSLHRARARDAGAPRRRPGTRSLNSLALRRGGDCDRARGRDPRCGRRRAAGGAGSTSR